MNLENLKTELTRQGIKVDIEECSIVKNGIRCKAIKLMNAVNDNVYPVIYYSEQETVSEIADRIFNAVYKCKPKIDCSLLMDPEYVMDHIYIGVQRKSDEELVKRSYLNLDLILRIYLSLGDETETGTVKVTENLLHCLDELTADDLWERAIENSRPLYRIQSMGEIFGMEDDKYVKLYVGNADRLSDAASIIAFPEYFREFCHGHKCGGAYVLPSSSQEMIIIPDNSSEEKADPQVMADMVREINESQVDPVLRLEPCCYRYTLATDTVEIAAIAGK